MRDLVSYELVNGSGKYRGSYVPFEDALRLCQSYKLDELTERLRKVKEKSGDEGIILSDPQLNEEVEVKQAEYVA